MIGMKGQANLIFMGHWEYLFSSLTMEYGTPSCFASACIQGYFDFMCVILFFFCS